MWNCEPELDLKTLKLDLQLRNTRSHTIVDVIQSVLVLP